MDEEMSMRGNIDKSNAAEMYGNDDITPTEAPRRPDAAAFQATDFARTEDQLKAHMAQMEAEDLARAKEWTATQNQLKMEQAALAQAEAARAQLAERKPMPTAQPIKQPGFAIKLAAFVRSFFPSPGQRKPA